MILPYIHENLRQSQTLLVTIQCRAGRDTVHLVTVVPVEVQRNSGQELLSDYQKQAVRSMIDVRADVVVSFCYIYCFAIDIRPFEPPRLCACLFNQGARFAWPPRVHGAIRRLRVQAWCNPGRDGECGADVKRL